MRRAQAMVETLIAMLVILLVFTGAHLISRMVAARTLLDHAAARAARAKAVGFNGFMCEKTALSAMIPVAGERLWPEEPGFDEASRVPIYLAAEDWGVANGILEYEHWHTTDIEVSPGGGLAPVVDARVDMSTSDFDMSGRAQVESHFQLYMDDEGR